MTPTSDRPACRSRSTGLSVRIHTIASVRSTSDSPTPYTATGNGPIHAYSLVATVSQPLSGPHTGTPPPSSTTDR